MAKKRDFRKVCLAVRDRFSRPGKMEHVVERLNSLLESVDYTAPECEGILWQRLAEIVQRSMFFPPNHPEATDLNRDISAIMQGRVEDPDLKVE